MQSPAEREEGVSGTQLWLLLLKSFHAVSAYAQATLRETGLGDSDFRVLEALLHKGALPVNEIGQKVFLTPGAISTAVERLHVQGLVVRQDSKSDRRVRLVGLTAAGRTLIERAFWEHARKMDVLGEELTPKQRRQLARGLKAFGKAAQLVDTKDGALPERRGLPEPEPAPAAVSALARERKKTL